MIYLIISAGVKMLKKADKNPISVVLFVITLVCLVVTTLLSKKISTIIYILVGGTIGVTAYLISRAKKRKNKGEDKK